MNPQSLVNLNPIVHVMLMGAVLALGPLAWVWLRHPGASPVRRLQILTLLTAFLTFDLILFGAFTRLTDSGLGCPDWPGCYGSASPTGAVEHITAAQTAMPHGPVTHSKAWIEMIHRYMATAVGVLILTLALAHWRQWRMNREPRSALKPWWATATLVWVCIQGAFGALTVTMKLFPAIVTLHLLGGVVLLALLCAQAAQSMESQPPARVTGHVRGLLWLAGGAVVMQLLLGGWVSTNYAVLACNTFPTCQDSWWPVMDFDQGFELWRPLGHTARGELLGFAALTAIHFMHRLFAVVVVVTLVLLIRRLWQHVALARQGRYLAGLLLAQIGTGLSNVVLDWPLAAAVAHTGGAAAMVAVITWALASSRLTVAAAISISSSLVPEKSA